MKRIPNSIILLLISALAAAGCTKVPEKIQSPSVKIDVEIRDNQEFFLLNFNGGIQNKNSDIAFLDFKGKVLFIDSESGDVIASLPFNLPVILPFDTGIIDLKLKKTESKIMPLIGLLGINREELINNKSAGKTFIDEENIRLDDISYKKKGIIKLFKERINEED